VRSGAAGGVVRVPRRDGASPYVVLIAPLPNSTGLDGGDAEEPTVLILIHDPNARMTPTPETIATMFGLPIGTARLIAALVEGEDAKAYAERYKITTDGIKFHLKTAFARTGLRSQARLLQLAHHRHHRRVIVVSGVEDRRLSERHLKIVIGIDEPAGEEVRE
jgi:hypothetical protein